jgi:uncharacterized DUF497 family protein
MRIVEGLEFNGFEWDEAKRKRVLEAREIDFLDAVNALLEPHLEKLSDQLGEIRFLAVCEIKTELVTVIYTLRDRNCRIITARASRKNERKQYREIFG